MLELNQVSAAYGNARVLFDLTLGIETGQIVALMGRNGMGKTTAIRSVMGLIPGVGGSIRFQGREILGKSPHQIARMGIGLVPEGRQIFTGLRVEENLTAFYRPAARGWDLDRVYGLFPVLKERAGHMGSQISGGEQQMLAMGRALMTNPSLLILDEATEGLAPKIRERIWDCLSAIRDTGVSVLVVDKSIRRAREICDKIYILEKGGVIWAGDREQLNTDREKVCQALGV